MTSSNKWQEYWCLIQHFNILQIVLFIIVLWTQVFIYYYNYHFTQKPENLGLQTKMHIESFKSHLYVPGFPSKIQNNFPNLGISTLTEKKFWMLSVIRLKATCTSCTKQYIYFYQIFILWAQEIPFIDSFPSHVKLPLSFLFANTKENVYLLQGLIWC